MNNDNPDYIEVTAQTNGAKSIVPQLIQENNQPSIYSKIQDPLVAIREMGEMIASSGMFGCTKAEQGMVLAMQCLAENKAPLELAKTYHILDGKLSMRADAMLGRFLATGGEVQWVRRDNEVVEALWSYGKSKDVPIKCTIEDMKSNGVAMDKSGKYLKTNWQRHPRQMLTARVISEAVRLLAPQLVAGVYTPEEVQDFVSENKPNVQVATQVRSVPQIAEAKPADLRASLNKRLDDLLLIYEPQASQELVKLGYIKEGQNYYDLDASSAARLLDNPAKFISRLEQR